MKMNLRWMMMKKSVVNFSFKIAAQFLPSNQWGQLARARLTYLKKMPDFFFLVKWPQTKSKSKNLMRMNLRWMMVKKSIDNFSFKIAAQFLPSNHWGQLARAALSISGKCWIFFLVKWRQTKSKSEKLMKMNLRWMMMKTQSWILHSKLPRNFFHQISVDGWHRRALSIPGKHWIFFSYQMTANKVKVQKIDEDESQMDDDEKIYHEFFI